MHLICLTRFRDSQKSEVIASSAWTYCLGRQLVPLIQTLPFTVSASTIIVGCKMQVELLLRRVLRKPHWPLLDDRVLLQLQLQLQASGRGDVGKFLSIHVLGEDGIQFNERATGIGETKPLCMIDAYLRIIEGPSIWHRHMLRVPSHIHSGIANLVLHIEWLRLHS
jgi:hypothetical protein